MAAASEFEASFDLALAATLKDLNIHFSLRDEQITALKCFLEKRDVFGVLPTGYGKSLTTLHHLLPGALATSPLLVALIGCSPSYCVR